MIKKMQLKIEHNGRLVLVFANVSSYFRSYYFELGIWTSYYIFHFGLNWPEKSELVLLSGFKGVLGIFQLAERTAGRPGLPARVCAIQ